MKPVASKDLPMPPCPCRKDVPCLYVKQTGVCLLDRYGSIFKPCEAREKAVSEKVKA